MERSGMSIGVEPLVIPYFDSIFQGDNVVTMRQWKEECIDLTVTSPPYDNLRTYGGHDWDFENVARELFRVTKKGCVVVWVVAGALRAAPARLIYAK